MDYQLYTYIYKLIYAYMQYMFYAQHILYMLHLLYVVHPGPQMRGEWHHHHTSSRTARSAGGSLHIAESSEVQGEVGARDPHRVSGRVIG